MYYLDEVKVLRNKLTARHRAGEYTKCIYIGEKLVQLHKKHRNTHSMNFADDLFNLALIYEETGRVNRAMDMYADSMRVVEVVAGKGLDYARRLTNLGIACGKNGSGSEAIELLAQAENIIRKTFGKEHTESIYALYNYANSLYDAGLYKRALKTHSEALLTRRKLPEDTGLADSLNACGYCHEALEEWDEAEKFLLEALEVSERVCGAQSDEYISQLMYYAAFLGNNNRADDSVKRYNKCTQLIKKMYSDSHIYYAGALNYTAEAYEKAGNIKKSLTLKLRAIGILEKSLGGNHMYFANNLKSIAMGYHAMGDEASAIKVMKKALKIKEALVGRANVDYTRDMLLLLMFYLEEVNYVKMAETLRAALKDINFSDPETPSLYSGLRDLCLLTSEMAKLQRGVGEPDFSGVSISSNLKKAEAMTELFKRISESIGERSSAGE